ncbi:MAG TPA: DUF72 domain-containing protein [Nitrospira sp.]|nr:DUF72 domain-containing protein [Nitrospira sp.]
MARLFIGTSGWVYGAWKGRFYPPTLPDAQRLSYYATRFITTEVNYSYYHVPSAETYRRWTALIPPQFVFVLKANRSITHLARLKNVEALWSEFVEGARNLGRHLGPILVQLAPSFLKDEHRLESFLDLASGDRTIRLAFEFRHESWFAEQTYRLLARYGAALCIADSIHRPRVDRVTADFAYLRYHGRTPREAPCYTDEELRQEATLIERLIDEGLDTYAFFNNDALAHSAANAATLQSLVSENRHAA